MACQALAGSAKIRSSTKICYIYFVLSLVLPINPNDAFFRVGLLEICQKNKVQVLEL